MNTTLLPSADESGFDARRAAAAPPLTSAQRKALRAQAHHLDPVVMIGDSGLSAAVIAETDRALSAHQLIKIRVLGDDRQARADMLQALCAALGCAPVQSIGKLLVVWRPAPAESGPGEFIPKKQAERASVQRAGKAAGTGRATGNKRPSQSATKAKPSQPAARRKAPIKATSGTGASRSARKSDGKSFGQSSAKSTSKPFAAKRPTASPAGARTGKPGDRAGGGLAGRPSARPSTRPSREGTRAGSARSSPRTTRPRSR